jgi:para-aminobenzoate synthetase component 1
MIVREIEWRDPVAAFAPLAGEPFAQFLGGGARAEGARWSFLCVRPDSLIEVRRGETKVDGADVAKAPFEALRDLHERRRRDVDAAAVPLLSGVVGFAGYECGGVLEPSAAGPPSTGAAPDFFFAAYDAVAAFDRDARRAFIGAPYRSRALALEALLGDAPCAPSPPALSFSGSTFSAARYRGAVRDVINRILDGAVYQANISHRLRFKADEPVNAFALFAAAAAQSAAAHGAYLNLGATQIVSLSPERFFSISHDAGGRTIRAEPIKGTRPRGATPEEDAALARQLEESAKDRAENIMIADLTRNDLSRICVDGSIREEAICERLTLATVHHLVSRISGRLREDVGAPAALAALFPCGSITGAPKVEAMRMIAAIEGAPRGPYCGAIGYIDDRGGADFSVAIRTALVEGRCVTLPVGGGVTLRSDPESEYQETLDKAAWFLRLVGVERASVA